MNREIFWNIDFNSGSGAIPSSLVTTGVLGFAAWVTLLVLLVTAGLYFFRRGENEDSHIRSISFGTYLASLYLFSALFFSSPTISILLLAFAFAGMFSASLALQGRTQVVSLDFAKESAKNFATSLSLIVLLAVVGAGTYFSAEKLYAHYSFGKGVVAFNTVGNAKQARADIERAFLLSKSDLYARALSELALNEANVLASAPEPKPEELEGARNAFLEALQRGIVNAQEATRINPNNYKNWVTLARAYEPVVPLKINGAYENSKQAYERAIANNPQNPALYVLLARLEVLNGNLDLAKEEVGKAIVMKPNYTDAIFLLSQIEVTRGNIRGAIQSVESASTISNDPTIFFQLGFLYYNDKNFRRAIDAFEKAIILQPDYSNARYFLGLSYDKLGKKEEAVEQFAKVEELNPQNAEVKFILENLRANRAPFDQAKPPVDDKPEKRKNLPVSETKTESDL